VRLRDAIELVGAQLDGGRAEARASDLRPVRIDHEDLDRRASSALPPLTTTPLPAGVTAVWSA
jgi:hypothetical protein